MRDPEHLIAMGGSFRDFIEALPAAALVADVAGRVVVANAHASGLFGYGMQDFEGMAVDQLLGASEDADHGTILEACRLAGCNQPAGQDMRVQIRTQGGLTYPSTVGLEQVSTDQGSFTLVTFKHSAAPYVDPERQQAQRLEFLGVHVGCIAHDVNNLLATVLGNASLALRQIPPSSDARASVQEIELASRHAAELVGQLLAFAGRAPFRIQAVHLVDLVEEMLRLLRSLLPKRAALTLMLADDLPPVKGDVAQLRQVVMNIITNAADALGGVQGTVTIRTALVGADDAARMWRGISPPDGDYVCVEVSDTGCGMDQQTVSRIFEPFFTTKAKGRGLGLSAVFEIVRRHGGTIDVRSQPGRGTTFTVLLPAARGAEYLDDRRSDDLEDWRGSGLVLVIDDESGVRDLAKRILTRQGFDVITAVDGRDGVDTFERHRDDVRLVLLDLTMPALTGEEVLREIRRLRPEVPVVLTSGYDEMEAVRPFAGQALAGFVPKPFDVADLLVAIRNACRVERPS